MASTLQFLKHPLDLLDTLWKTPAAVPTPGATAQAADLVASPTVPDTAPTLTGLCGWVSPEPGAPGNFSCQFGGTVMPGIVYFVSLGVVAVTVFFVIRYLRRSLSLAEEIENLSSRIAKISGAGAEWARPEACEKILKTVSDSGARAPPLSLLAERIRAARLSLPASEGVAFRESIRDISREVRTSENWSGRALAESLPGWLTAIGLLTTFLAILLGLQSVRVLANLEVRGIGGLVNGLSGKFFSSIAALGCAVTVTILHYFVSSRVRETWNRLSDRLQEHLPHLSVERAFLTLLARENQRGR